MCITITMIGISFWTHMITGPRGLYGEKCTLVAYFLPHTLYTLHIRSCWHLFRNHNLRIPFRVKIHTCLYLHGYGSITDVIIGCCAMNWRFLECFPCNVSTVHDRFHWGWLVPASRSGIIAGNPLWISTKMIRLTFRYESSIVQGGFSPMGSS